MMSLSNKTKVVKTLLNQLSKHKPWSKNKDKYEEACTNIYILHSNRDDDELIIQSINEQINNENTKNNTTNTKKQRSKPIRLSNSDKLMKRIMKYEAIHALEDIVNDNLYKGQVKYKSKYINESPMLIPKCIACQYIKCFCSYKTTE